MPIEKILWAISLYGKETKKGIVELRIGDSNVQCSPEEAREFALNIMTAAEAAETDEFLMHFMREIIKISDDDYNHLKFLKEFRNFREQKKRVIE